LAPSFPQLYVVWSQGLSDLSLVRLCVTCSQFYAQLYEQAQPYELVQLYEVVMFWPQQALLLVCIKFWESLYIALCSIVLCYIALC
jgi:hypothetical protein